MGFSKQLRRAGALFCALAAAGSAAAESATDPDAPAAIEIESSGDGAGDPASAEALPAALDGTPEAAVTVLEPDPARAEARAAALPEPTAALPAAPAPSSGRALGPIAYDAEGRQGRIHTVVLRDTLWDISDAYLGSAWVWPSVWRENDDIANPHLIYPGDRIWITDGEMRRVSREEAEQMLARGPAAPAPEPEALADLEPIPPPDLPRTWRVPAREMSGLVTTEELESAASVVEGVPDRVFLAQEDRVYVGLGEGQAAVGDEYTVFRTRERVYDPDGGRLLGYHVDILGWLEVERVHAETSVAQVRVSHGEIERGDRVMPRERLLVDVPIQPAPAGIDAQISFFGSSRTMTGQADFLYLNRGTLHGLEVGSPLEVYRPSFHTRETARRERVEVPDQVLAQLLVVRAGPESAVAYVVSTERELEVGDQVRGATAGVLAAR